MAKSSVRICLRFFPIAGILWLFVVIPGHSQENQNPTSNPVQKAENTKSDFTIKVDVEEVRLDAVVEDWRSRLITDLTAEDFEIYQDGRKQDITSCQYIQQEQERIKPHDQKQIRSRTVPAIPTPPLKRNSVERTIIFLINDFFGMVDLESDSRVFKYIYHARMALRQFVEEQMMPGDLVSIIKTSP